MSKVKNISGSDVHLVVPGFDAVVPPGGVVEAPDFQPAHNPDSQPGDPDHLAISYDEYHWELADGDENNEAAE